MAAPAWPVSGGPARTAKRHLRPAGVPQLAAGDAQVPGQIGLGGLTAQLLGQLPGASRTWSTSSFTERLT